MILSVCKYPEDTWIATRYDQVTHSLVICQNIRWLGSLSTHIDHILARSMTVSANSQADDDWTYLLDSTLQDSSTMSGKQVTPDVHPSLRCSIRLQCYLKLREENVEAYWNWYSAFVSS